MSKHFLKTLALIAALWAGADAAGKNFGLGGMLGSPTGFSAKYWTSGRTALDFALGWTGSPWYGNGYYDDDCYRPAFRRDFPGYCSDQRFDNGRYDRGYGWRILHFHADYLFHNFNAIRSSEKFPLFYGPGLILNYVDNNFAQAGVRGDFGIAWLPRRTPMDVFFELGPGFLFLPYPAFDLDASIGARFYF